ncbi:hypothetical protein DTO282F9_2984 [Paecilomyces variotii]|nr:hypothetical protein DTO282F9_2984 [Paecilomyces variotii]
MISHRIQRRKVLGLLFRELYCPHTRLATSTSSYTFGQQVRLSFISQPGHKTKPRLRLSLRSTLPLWTGLLYSRALPEPSLTPQGRQNTMISC